MLMLHSDDSSRVGTIRLIQVKDCITRLTDVDMWSAGSPVNYCAALQGQFKFIALIKWNSVLFITCLRVCHCSFLFVPLVCRRTMRINILTPRKKFVYSVERFKETSRKTISICLYTYVNFKLLRMWKRAVLAHFKAVWWHPVAGSF
jgi:hypothetical protein